MVTKVKRLPVSKQFRATIIELSLNGNVGNAVYLNNIDPTDTDQAIKSALEYRFPGAVSLRNQNIEFDSDIRRVTGSFLMGSRQSDLIIELRTFSPNVVLDHIVQLKFYWCNLRSEFDAVDLMAFHDCTEYDCETISHQVEKIIPLERMEPVTPRQKKILEEQY